MTSSAGLVSGYDALLPLQGGVALVPVHPSAEELISRQSRRDRFVKRSGDIVFSLAVLSLGAPVF
jgi:hypothetical protein